MNEYKTDEIKKLVAEKIKYIKGDTPYSKIAEKRTNLIDNQCLY